MCMTMCAQTPEGRGETRGAGAVPRCAWSLVLASVESRVVAAKATLLCCFNCTVLSWLVVLDKLVYIHIEQGGQFVLSISHSARAQNSRDSSSDSRMCRTCREGMRERATCGKGGRGRRCV